MFTSMKKKAEEAIKANYPEFEPKLFHKEEKDGDTYYKVAVKVGQKQWLH